MHTLLCLVLGQNPSIRDFYRLLKCADRYTIKFKRARVYRWEPIGYGNYVKHPEIPKLPVSCLEYICSSGMNRLRMSYAPNGVPIPFKCHPCGDWTHGSHDRLCAPSYDDSLTDPYKA